MEVALYDTKIAFLLDGSLETWQKLNVTAFLASGIAASLPQLIGEPYEDGAGRVHARLLTHPMMIFAATPEILRSAWAKSIERNLVRAGYVRAMFSTNNDISNREVFRVEPADAPDLVGIALYGDKKDVDKAIKGATRHP